MSQPSSAQPGQRPPPTRRPRRRPRGRGCGRGRSSSGRSRRRRRSSAMLHARTTVDLELVDRQPLQVAERRVAAAEVVDREPHAELAELHEHRPAPGGSAMIVLSVISSSSAAGCDAGLGEQPRRPRSGKPQVEQVAARDVDGDRDVVARRLARRAHWRSAAFSTYSVSGRMRPVCSASGMNWSGGSRPCVGMLATARAPPSPDSPGHSAGLRLVVDDELACARGRGAGRPRA